MAYRFPPSASAFAWQQQQAWQQPGHGTRREGERDRMGADGGEHAVGGGGLGEDRPGCGGDRGALLGAARHEADAPPVQLAQAENHGLIAS